MFNSQLACCRNLILLFFAVTLMLAGCAAPGGSGQSMANTDGSVVMKGKVGKISLPDNTLTIKPRKGESVTVILNEKTVFAGDSSAAALKKNQPVEVAYRAEGTANVALSVKELPEGSCQ